MTAPELPSTAEGASSGWMEERRLHFEEPGWTELPGYLKMEEHLGNWTEGALRLAGAYQMWSSTD